MTVESVFKLQLLWIYAKNYLFFDYIYIWLFIQTAVLLLFISNFQRSNPLFSDLVNRDINETVVYTRLKTIYISSSNNGSTTVRKLYLNRLLKGSL